MQHGIVIGHATSTIKHPSFAGWKLAIVQTLGINDQPEADPIIAIDSYNAAAGQKVLVNCDGRAARELIGDVKSPVRWFVCGLIDETN